MFGTSRIAATGVDRVVRQWPCLQKHINVIYKDQVFSVDVIGPHGETVPVKQIESQLRNVIKQVDETPLDRRQPPVGLLTTEHRDIWGPLREEMEKDTTNAHTFNNIDSSLFVFCLDDYSSPDDLDLSHRNIIHGKHGRNRWFDKALSFIVENNGRAGINGEHSPADAVVPQRIVDDILLRVLLHYNEYGSSFMKKAKVSPDAWLQMVYQLAYYRQYGKPCPTYESASTRKFLTGRTETVRSCSAETLAFTKAWDNKDVKMTDKLQLLNQAIASHLEYMKAATNGKGKEKISL
ncbi:hypothetical protein BDB01DRAFT_844408 [Pilobolus umbonatus]|nr:hypothetical protein BDB01DRAFT_844408 [Pilobolus umbonatus]